MIHLFASIYSPNYNSMGLSRMLTASSSSIYLPIFLPSVAMGILWSLSLLWIYRRYRLKLSAKEQAVVWGGIRRSSLIFATWCLSMAISSAAMTSSWILLCFFEGSDIAKQMSWDSSYIFVFPCMFVFLSAFNLVVLDKDFYVVTLVLVGIASSYAWLWVTCWLLFHDQIWLHALNSYLLFHAVCVDGMFWLFTWQVGLKEDNNSKTNSNWAPGNSALFVILENDDESLAFTQC